MKSINSKKYSESTHTASPFLSGDKKGSFFSTSSQNHHSFFGPSGIQPKLEIGQPNDKYEKEADHVADTVMRMPDPQVQRQPMEEEEEELQMKRVDTLIQRKCEGCEEEEKLQKKSDGKSTSADRASNISSQLASKSGTGNRLPKPVRSEMAHKMGADFSGVNIHTGPAAHELSNQLGARAFTYGSDIYFNKGEYNPDSSEGKHLLAHELTHVVQQRDNTVQRVVEVRPPGRGEASAFDRRDELIARINEQSDYVRYRLEGRRIEYEDIPSNEVILNPFGVRSPNFDQKMKEYIDRAEVIPMRLITSAGFVGGDPLLVDSLQLAYVDLDDLLGRDDLSFQLNLIHILTERFGVNDYERRIGTNMPEFDRVHRAGLEDEAEHLQSVIGDPTIRFNYEETRPNGTVVFAFRSDEGYRVFHVFRRAGQAERSGDIFVQMPDRRRLTIDELRAEREAVAVP